jgi:serine/threonine protein kinase
LRDETQAMLRILSEPRFQPNVSHLYDFVKSILTILVIVGNDWPSILLGAAIFEIPSTFGLLNPTDRSAASPHLRPVRSAQPGDNPKCNFESEPSEDESRNLASEDVCMSVYLPSKIGKYDVFGLVARGGVGTVFTAIDPQLYRRVAIKLFAGAFTPSADLRNFSRRAQSAASLQHPNIVKIYEVGVHDGNPYVVMELLEGELLAAALNDCRNLSLLEKISIVIQVCHGLAYAHRQGIPHYDIKPAKIMSCRDGRIKILGFGMVDGLNQAVTRRAEAIGGPMYLAPEQVNSGSVDFRADIFSAGVVLYQLISNHFPFEGDRIASTIFKVVHESPPPLSTFLGTYPPDIEAILFRAMAKRPEDRYNSADALASDLEHLLGQLKEDVVSHQMQKLLSSPDQGESFERQPSLPPAPDMADQQSTPIQLLANEQSRFQQDEVSKPLFGLWVRAEKALADGQFEEAREHAEQALALDPDDADLQELWETIRVEAARTEKLRRVLNVALAAQAEGNLDAARKAAEQAVEVAPDNAEAKALYQLISRDILEGARQRQIENYLKDARQQISSGRFSGAIEILGRAEELDPNAPGVQSLIRLALSGQQQELRRKEIENLRSLIQDALNGDDYDTAIRKAEEGLVRFPQDRTLVNLKAQAKSQLLLAECKREAETKLAAERDLFEARQIQEKGEAVALDPVLRRVEEEPDLSQSKIILETALQKLPGHRQLQEKLAEVSHLDRMVSNAVREARKLEEAGQYELALAKWEMVGVLHPRYPDLKSAAKRIRGLQQHARANSRQVWIDRIERALRMSDFNEAFALVERAVQEFPWDSDLMELQERTESALRQRVKAQKSLAEAQKLLSRQQWQAGAQRLVRAYQVAPEDLFIRAQVVEGLSLASRDAMQKDRRAAEVILQELAQIEPAGTVSVGLPTDSQESEPDFRSQRDPDAAADRLNGDKLQIIERQLAAIIGPVAKELVTQAAAKTTSVKEICTILVPQLDQQAERTAFLERIAEVTSAYSEMPSSPSRLAETPSIPFNAAPLSQKLEEYGMLTPGDAAKPTISSQGAPLSKEITLPPGLLIDNAHFTVTAPGLLPRGATSEIQFWVQVGQQTETVLKRARELCGLDDIDTPKSEPPYPLKRGPCVSVRLRLGDTLKCVDSHKWVVWTGDIGIANFVVTVPSEVLEGDLVCVASIRLNGCQVGKLSFLLNIGSSRLASQVIPCQTVMHRRAFASYANLDRDQVLARVQDMETAYKGLRVYVDSVALRSATYWEPDLHARIDAADVFYLFWCRHAMASDWVSREWRWALKSKGLDFIDPVPLESREQASPPVELMAKDFNGPLLPFMAIAGIEGDHS